MCQFEYWREGEVGDIRLGAECFKKSVISPDFVAIRYSGNHGVGVDLDGRGGLQAIADNQIVVCRGTIPLPIELILRTSIVGDPASGGNPTQ